MEDIAHARPSRIQAPLAIRGGDGEIYDLGPKLDVTGIDIVGRIVTRRLHIRDSSITGVTGTNAGFAIDAAVYASLVRTSVTGNAGGGVRVNTLPDTRQPHFEQRRARHRRCQGHRHRLHHRGQRRRRRARRVAYPCAGRLGHPRQWPLRHPRRRFLWLDAGQRPRAWGLFGDRKRRLAAVRVPARGNCVDITSRAIPDAAPRILVQHQLSVRHR